MNAPQTPGAASLSAAKEPLSCMWIKANKGFRRNMTLLVVGFLTISVLFLLQTQSQTDKIVKLGNANRTLTAQVATQSDQIKEQTAQISALIGDNQQTCKERQDARYALRTILGSALILSAYNQSLIDTYLPPLSCLTPP